MMNETTTIAPLEELKAQAKRLRQKLLGEGVQISHSKALELIAHQYGVRDWNTLHAQAGNRMHLRVGDRVSGRYLGQPFTAEIRGMTMLGDGSHRRLTLQFDEPVDVVRFDSFSSFRQRVTGEIGWDGRSARQTSDGEPQLVVHPE
ncbi:glyoxalase superfamily protein [Ruegeria arenilitoris]|uniref:glyoxalase superfamily protein n=1 Tax=Ruegeria arenilitoris TaxID=1173585 RepID=UPI003F5CEF2F